MSTESRTAHSPAETRFQVEGMSCASCVRHVETAIKSVPGVQSATVDLQGKQAVVHHTGGPDAVRQIEEAVEEAGYEAHAR